MVSKFHHSHVLSFNFLGVERKASLDFYISYKEEAGQICKLPARNEKSVLSANISDIGRYRYDFVYRKSDGQKIEKMSEKLPKYLKMSIFR